MTEKKTHWELNGRARTQDTLEVRHFHCTERKSKQTGQTLEVRHSRHPPERVSKYLFASWPSARPSSLQYSPTSLKTCGDSSVSLTTFSTARRSGCAPNRHGLLTSSVSGLSHFGSRRFCQQRQLLLFDSLEVGMTWRNYGTTFFTTSSESRPRTILSNPRKP